MNAITHAIQLDAGDTFALTPGGDRLKASAVLLAILTSGAPVRVYDVITVADQTLPLKRVEPSAALKNVKAGLLALEACRRLRDACRTAAEVMDTVDPKAVEQVWEWASAALKANGENASLIRGEPVRR